MIFAVRRRNENNEQLMRRFKKQVQSTGTLMQVRDARYWKQDKKKRRIREEAISREGYRKARKKRILWN